jgi:hypothetical protein
VAVPTTGGTPATLASGLDAPTALAVDANALYYSTFDLGAKGTVVALPLDGGVPLTLATEQSYVQAIVLDASYVYWTTEDDATGKPPGSVLRVAK